MYHHRQIDVDSGERKTPSIKIFPFLEVKIWNNNCIRKVIMYCNIFTSNNSESTILLALDKEKNVKSTDLKYYSYDRLENYFKTHTPKKERQHSSRIHISGGRSLGLCLEKGGGGKGFSPPMSRRVYPTIWLIPWCVWCYLSSPTPNGQKDSCENITFPQLRLQAVKIHLVSRRLLPEWSWICHNFLFLKIRILFCLRYFSPNPQTNLKGREEKL